MEGSVKQKQKKVRAFSKTHLPATECASECECLEDGFKVAGRRLSADSSSSVRKKEVAGAFLL
jgi:hypothetical protein